MSEEDWLTGGCLCGAVRYAVEGPAVETTLCHCADCRRASGAPYVAWTFFPHGSLQWTGRSPKVISFSDRERSFCGDCGTPLHFFDPGIPDWFEINTCSLDDPDAHTPANECWLEDRLEWARLRLELPAFHQSAPLPQQKS